MDRGVKLQVMVAIAVVISGGSGGVHVVAVARQW
jgi:hypothetical protein